MQPIDWIVILIYFCIIGFVAWWSGRNQKSTKDYFLAGRNVGFFAIGASIFTSNIGSEHIVGLAGQGASTGMAMAHWELHAWCMILLAYFFVPFYYRSGVYTIPEFIEKRFNAKARWILSLVSLVAYVFTKVSVTVYAGALVFQTLLPDTFQWGPAEQWASNAFWVGAILTVVLTGVYTVFGGMRAVIFTSAPQAILLVLGSFLITAYGIGRIDGGWPEMVNTCRENAENFALWRPLSDPDFPWLGVLIASPIIGIWYWCTDQYIVQRTLAGKDMKTARRGALFGGVLKTTPVLIFLVPGMIGWVLDEKYNEGISDELAAQTYSVEIASSEKKQIITDANAQLKAHNAAKTEGGQAGFYIPRDLKKIDVKGEDGAITQELQLQIDGDKVFPSLVSSLLPAGLRGLIVATLLAALMSSLASLFNSSASLFTVDIYEKLRPGRSEGHYVFVGRVATTVVVGLGLLWIPVMKLISGGGLYQYLQSVQGYLAPPITAVFLLGLFWGRINAAGAVWGLGGGFVLGMIKLTTQTFFSVTDPSKANVPILGAIGDFSFLYATGVLFVASIVLVIVASMMTKPPTAEQLEGLTYGSIKGEAADEWKSSWDGWNKFLAALVLVIVVVMYLYFSFWLS